MFTSLTILASTIMFKVMLALVLLTSFIFIRRIIILDVIMQKSMLHSFSFPSFVPPIGLFYHALDFSLSYQNNLQVYLNGYPLFLVVDLFEMLFFCLWIFISFLLKYALADGITHSIEFESNYDN